MVEVAADAGMGKTRLLDELLARTAETVRYTAECRLYQSSTPYFPFRLLLRHALGLAEDESAAGQLTELIADRASHLLPWASLIGMPLDIAVDESDDVRALEDEFRRARLEEAVVDLLSNVLTAPVVLTIEDTHWMDEASRDLLARMSSVVGERPWLVILTRRPGDDGFSAARDAVTATTLALAPLSVDAAAAIINAATADTPLIPQQVHALAERAQGNPLFVIELLDALRRGEDVDSLPHSVEGLIQARIDRLPPADRSLLRDVSVLGTGFQVEHAAAVLPEGLGLAGRRVLRRLAGFLSISQTGWVQFRHALIRDVAYQSLPYKTRRELHARVGDSIYRDAGEHPEAQADLLSLHYYAAKRWREAWEYGRVAGDNARGIYANLEAATFYRRAVTASRYLGDVAETTLAIVLESLGDALGQAGLYAEAVDAYRKAGERVADDVARAGLLYKRAQTRARTGSYAQALRETTIGHRLLERAGDGPAREARARLTAFAASVRASQGRYREALLLAEEAKAEAESAGERASLARAYATLDDALEMLGKPDDAVYLPMALAIYEELGDLANVAGITNNLGVRANSVAKWDEAIDYYRISEETWRRVGDDAAAAFVQVNLGELLVSRGQVEEAAEILGEALRVLRAHNDENVAFAQIQWGRLALERGDLVGAVAILDQARDGAAAAGQLQVAYEATLYLGAARVKQGDAGGALDLVNQLDRSRLSELLIPILSLVRAQALLKLGRREQAAEVAAEGISYARRLGMPYEEARLLNVEARSIGPAGSEPDTVLLRESTRLLVALGCRRG
jgi:tetratricopeptide (TPR) repeat protein